MSDYDDTNTGALFKNDKGDVENRPDYKGPLNVNGEEMQVAAWLRVAKSGQKYMSLKVDKKYEAPTNQPDDPGTSHDLDDEVPF